MIRINKLRNRVEVIFDHGITRLAALTHAAAEHPEPNDSYLTQLNEKAKTAHLSNRSLCDLCRKICLQIDAILSMSDLQQSCSAPRPILGAPNSWNPTTCSTCWFFLDIINEHNGSCKVMNAHHEPFLWTSNIWLEFHPARLERNTLDPNPEAHRLVAYLREDTSDAMKRKFGKNIIPRPITFISVGFSNKFSGISSHKVDFSLVNEWLDICGLNHLCHSHGFSHTIDITLINCTTRQLEQKTSAESFIALSYVWGQTPTAAPQSIESQLSEPPLLIKDAIQVCKQVGINYLWVDRYCISQDPMESHKQIANMDAVYQEARVTIIAASAKDISCGLPGVSRLARCQQPFIETDRWTMISSAGEPQDDVEQSTWNNRGWTYQEALLSTRRLFFTEEQVFFECQTSIWTEALTNRPWKPYFNGVFRKEDETRLTTSCPHMFQSYDNMKIGTIWKIIAAYSIRKLTYPSDALNAMLGILRFLSRDDYSGPKNKRIYHHWGIPFEFIPNDPKRYNIAAEQFMGGLAFERCWLVGKKREGFPNWSWTAWTWKIAQYCPELKPIKIRGFKKIAVVAVESKNGLHQTWEFFLDNFLTANPSDFNIYIHVAVSVISLCMPHRVDCYGKWRLIGHYTLGGREVHAAHERSISVTFRDQELEDRNFEINKQPFICVLVGIYKSLLVALVLEEWKDCFQVVGTMELRLDLEKSFGRDTHKLKRIVLIDGDTIPLSLIEYKTLRLG